MTPSSAVATIGAMITPALFILGSASLVASALVRMARVVDRARTLAAIAHQDGGEQLGVTPGQLRRWLERHATRARYAERSILFLYGAVVAFIATSLAIELDRLTGQTLEWVSLLFASGGAVALLLGGMWMVAECRMSGDQIAEETQQALSRLEQRPP
jgi:hypothetical protein